MGKVEKDYDLFSFFEEVPVLGISVGRISTNQSRRAMQTRLMLFTISFTGLVEGSRIGLSYLARTCPVGSLVRQSYREMPFFQGTYPTCVR